MLVVFFRLLVGCGFDCIHPVVSFIATNSEDGPWRLPISYHKTCIVLFVSLRKRLCRRTHLGCNVGKVIGVVHLQWQLCCTAKTRGPSPIPHQFCGESTGAQNPVRFENGLRQPTRGVIYYRSAKSKLESQTPERNCLALCATERVYGVSMVGRKVQATCVHTVN